jgi:hypothetical protein
VWAQQGYSHAECDLLWQEHLEVGYAEQVCKKKGFTPEETVKQLDAFRAKLRGQRKAKGFLVRS